MLKAGSLIYAIAVSLVIAMVSSAIFILLADHEQLLAQDMLTGRLNNNSLFGIGLVMGNKFTTDDDDGMDVDLFEQGKDSVYIQSKAWGVFRVGVSRAHTGERSRVKVAMIGVRPADINREAICMAEMDRALKVCGRTIINGDCSLPAGGIERAYIEGESFLGDRLVNGRVRKSPARNYQINDEVVKYLEEMFGAKPGANDSIMVVSEFSGKDSVENSFAAKCILVLSADEVELNNTVTGNVCIVSNKRIHVKSTSSLENVLLFAPVIDVEDHTTGTFQAFATDSICVGEAVHLNYPSALGLIANEKSPDHAFIEFGQKAVLSGEVFALSTARSANKHVLISTLKQSLIYGFVLCPDQVDHKGTVIGGITCGRFRLKTNSGEYDNHLLNAVIDRTSLDEEFIAGYIGAGDHYISDLVEWLD